MGAKIMKVDINEIVAILVIGGISGGALFWLPGEGGKEIALALGSGVVGYLSKQAYDAAK